MDYLLDFKVGLYDAGFSEEQIVKATSTILRVLSDYDVTPRKALVAYDMNNELMIKKFFVAKIGNGSSERTLNYYKKTLEHILPTFKKNIIDVKPDDIRIYMSRRRNAGVSNTTIDNERRVLSSFFTFLHDEEMIKSNPMKRIQKVKQKKIAKKPFTEEELERIRVSATSRRDKAVIEFLFSTGCRVAEICALNRDSVDLERRSVMVIGKGNKEREVFISYRCLYALKEYLDERIDTNPSLFVCCSAKYPKKEQYLHQERITTNCVESLLKRVGNKSGVDNVHPHRFRRTCATVALRRGMPIEQVKDMLGHEQISTTLIYTEIDNEQLKRSHEKYIN